MAAADWVLIELWLSVKVIRHRFVFQRWDKQSRPPHSSSRLNEVAVSSFIRLKIPDKAGSRLPASLHLCFGMLSDLGFADQYLWGATTSSHLRVDWCRALTDALIQDGGPKLPRPTCWYWTRKGSADKDSLRPNLRSSCLNRQRRGPCGSVLGN